MRNSWIAAAIQRTLMLWITVGIYFPRRRWIQTTRTCRQFIMSHWTARTLVLYRSARRLALSSLTVKKNDRIGTGACGCWYPRHLTPSLSLACR